MKERFPENITGSQTRENLNKMARMELIALIMSIISLIASIGSLVYSIKIGNELYEPELKTTLSDETGTGAIHYLKHLDTLDWSNYTGSWIQDNNGEWYFRRGDGVSVSEKDMNAYFSEGDN